MELRKFLDKFGVQLARTIDTNLAPVYNPMKPVGVEQFNQKIAALPKKPFHVQAEIIKALSKALYVEDREHLFLVGECGVGKTVLALSTIAMSPKPIRVLVICPTHLVEKWIRETKQAIPDVFVIDLSVRNVITILRNLRSVRNKPQKFEIYVCSKERIKLGYGWKPAAIHLTGKNFPHCPDCAKPVMKDDEYIDWPKLSKIKFKCQECRSPLWQADPKLRRFSPAEYIKKYLKGFFDFAVLDEIHDFKAGDSLQGNAMGALLSAAKKCLCLTGTLNGGYADDLFFLLFRMAPSALKAEGFEYRNSMKWLETYGTLERVVITEESDHYYGRSRKRNQIIRKRPGVSPQVIGQYLLDKSCFIRLADVIEGLPPYEEKVVSIHMDAASGQKEAYYNLQANLRRMVEKYRSKAMASMLQGLLSYPDSCASFGEHMEFQRGDEIDIIKAPLIRLPKGKLLPKELELINTVTEEKAQNRKVLCYLTFTGKRDIRPRLQNILEDRRFKVAVLDASVEPKKREAWVQKHCQDIDVLLVNADLIKTGLDLYEFPTIVFYQIGYNIFTLRQASRRTWRIGQTQPVRVLFFCYTGTMQAIALTLIAKKLEIALLVEGDLPEGLAEYCTEDSSIIEEMGKALSNEKTYEGAEVAWANFRKKEIETQLGISGDKAIFKEVSTKEGKRAESIQTKTIVDHKVAVKVSFFDGKNKKKSTVEVKYGDLDSELKGKPVQFCLF